MSARLLRVLRASRKRIADLKTAPLNIELLERDSRYVSHGTLTVYSPSEERELEIEFRANRPEYLDSPNEEVMRVIAKEVADCGYRLRALVLHQPAGWHCDEAPEQAPLSYN